MAQLAQNFVELALGSIAVWLTGDKLLVNFFGAVILLRSCQGIAQVSERVSKAKGIARAFVEIHERLKRLNPARQSRSDIVEQPAHMLLLPRFRHANTEAFEHFHCPLALIRLQQLFRYLLRRPPILG